ncbi:MAG: type I-B CRISPR-associated protein Cas5b [bacterium]|jgi:CRISPR-associated protein Cas5h
MAVIFDVSGPIAMFRRPYTTTSSVSFPLPPPTTVAGLLAGIVGIGNGSHINAGAALYWEAMKGTQIALSILNPITWYSGTINFWNVKEPQKSPHIRVKHQFVKNPKYRVYVRGGLEDDLRRHLEAGTFIYTPCLGTAYALAEITYLGEFDVRPIVETRLHLNSVVPLPQGNKITVEIAASKGVFRDTLPFRLDSQRESCESITVLYPTAPDKQICLLAWEGLDVSDCRGECIAWFPAW